jgi:hypothetical protein
MNFDQIYNIFFNFYVEASFVAFLRIGLCSFTLFYLTYTLKNLWNFSSPHGLFPYKDYIKNKQPSLYNYNFFGNNKIGHLILFSSTYLFALCSMIGFLTNLSLLFLLITISKNAGDSFFRLGIFCLMVIDCGSKYSLDYLIGISSNKEFVNAWSLRLMQIFICSIYLFSSIYKLSDKYWINGDIIRNIISSETYGRRVFFRLFDNIYISKLISRMIVIYQFFSPLLFLIDETRYFAIIFGIFMHIGISIFMKIGAFGQIPIFFLLTFYSDLFNK